MLHGAAAAVGRGLAGALIAMAIAMIPGLGTVLLGLMVAVLLAVVVWPRPATLGVGR